MLKDTKSLGNNKAPACESRGFVHKKRGVHFDTPPSIFYYAVFVRHNFSDGGIKHALSLQVYMPAL
ncbi:hypothetical protein [uncultured Bacteroides sp.]|uniref:hypothetical protein n=1 Tax=uncultured Bacteroides sp. TaxID=162156 RepID=UPI0027DE8717|nr:hypothetical protein [uncultured Bacteroides sp.]